MERYVSTLVPLVMLWLAAQNLCAQNLVLERSYHDFGTLSRADVHHADFLIRNETTREAVLFRIEGPRALEVKMSSKTIAPGATETIRLHYNPEAVGAFDIEALVYASAWMKPRPIRLLGTATFARSGMPCPDFDAEPAGAMRPFAVSLRNAENKPLENARVRLFRDGRQVDEWRSDANGEALGLLQPGRYFVVADYKGATGDTAVYTSASRDHVLLLLPEEAQEIQEEVAMQTEKDESTLNAQQSGREEGEDARSEKTPITPEPLPNGAVPFDEGELLPTSLYKQSNVVFLVDVSTSMKHEGRLDLLKIAMTDLLAALRDADRFTLISYASETNTLVDARTSLDRQACADAIMSLQAKGSTEGAKALDKAGKAAAKHFLPEGSNQIILATDGAFNEGAGKAKKLVNKYRRKDIQTSVLCIRCGKFTTKEMTELAEVGAGQFVPITSADDAGARLLREVQRSALR